MHPRFHQMSRRCVKRKLKQIFLIFYAVIRFYEAFLYFIGNRWYYHLWNVPIRCLGAFHYFPSLLLPLLWNALPAWWGKNIKYIVSVMFSNKHTSERISRLSQFYLSFTQRLNVFGILIVDANLPWQALALISTGPPWWCGLTEICDAYAKPIYSTYDWYCGLNASLYINK